MAVRPPGNWRHSNFGLSKSPDDHAVDEKRQVFDMPRQAPSVILCVALRCPHGKFTLAMKGAEHITEGRLRELASDHKLEPSKAEDSHLEGCKDCLKRFIELVNEIKGKRGPSA